MRYQATGTKYCMRYLFALLSLLLLVNGVSSWSFPKSVTEFMELREKWKDGIDFDNVVTEDNVKACVETAAEKLKGKFSQGVDSIAGTIIGELENEEVKTSVKEMVKKAGQWLGEAYKEATQEDEDDEL